jgi:2-phosphosulfolactate phosphatase
MKKIEVCLSPALFPIYAGDRMCIVLIDAIRASATICTAFMNDVDRIVPVSTIEEAEDYKRQGYLTAGEREGDKIKGFDLGNSPESFTEEIVKGNRIAMTTTNGTQIVSLFREAKLKDSSLIIGSFINIRAIIDYLSEQKRDILLLCSGWKQCVNIEDSLLAGKIVDLLCKKGVVETAESSNLAKHYYLNVKEPLYDFIMKQSPRLLSKSKQLEKDFRYCLQEEITNVIPFLEENYLRV